MKEGHMYCVLLVLVIFLSTPAHAQKITCEEARDMAVNYAQNLEKSRTQVEVQLAQLQVAYKKLQDDFEVFRKKHADAADKKELGKKE
jgi:hypothetical protein